MSPGKTAACSSTGGEISQIFNFWLVLVYGELRAMAKVITAQNSAVSVITNNRENTLGFKQLDGLDLSGLAYGLAVTATRWLGHNSDCGISDFKFLHRDKGTA